MSAESLTATALANVLHEQRVDQQTRVGILWSISKEYHRMDQAFDDESFRRYFWERIRELQK